MRSWRVALAFDLSAQFTSWVPRSFAHFAKGRVADSKCRVFFTLQKKSGPIPHSSLPAQLHRADKNDDCSNAIVRANPPIRVARDCIVPAPSTGSGQALAQNARTGRPQFRIGKKKQKWEKTRGQTGRSATETIRPDPSNIQAAGDRGR